MSIEKYASKLEANQLLSQAEVRNLCETVKSLLVQEPNVVELSAEQYVVGDIHGQFYDLLKLLKETVPNGKDANWVFLGDYVDRGYHSIETISYLLCLKALRPGQIVLLRGNHESSSLTRIYGFYDEVHKKYGNPNVWKSLIQVFNYLPMCGVISEQIFCVHGGLSPSTPFLDDIEVIDRIKDIPETGAICDLVWSDPSPNEKEGWTANNRGAGYVFSSQVVKEFLFLNDLKMIARAHQLVEQGYTYNFGDSSFLTVWSAPNYCYRCGNQAAVVRLRQDGAKEFIKFTSAEETQKRKVHFDHVLPYFL